jgi:hypothetical protein
MRLRQREAVAESIANLLEIFRACGGRRPGSAKSTERALKVARQGPVSDKCPLCNKSYTHSHPMTCSRTHLFEEAAMRVAMGPLSSRGRGGTFGGLGAVDGTPWHAQRSVTRAPKCLVSADRQHMLTDLGTP